MRIFAIFVIFLVFTTNGVVNAAALSGLEQGAETTTNVQSPISTTDDIDNEPIYDLWWPDKDGNVKIYLGHDTGSMEIIVNENSTIWNVKEEVFKQKAPECDPKNTHIIGDNSKNNFLPVDDNEMMKPRLKQGEDFYAICLPSYSLKFKL